jgi:hypothetical protein
LYFSHWWAMATAADHGVRVWIKIGFKRSWLAKPFSCSVQVRWPCDFEQALQLVPSFK